MTTRRWKQLIVTVVVVAVGVPTVAATAAPTPAPPVVPSGRLAGLRFHVIAPGESLDVIANRYGVPVDRLQAANGMTPGQVYASARLLLDPPNGAVGAPGQAGPAPTTATGSYKVRSGDSFSRIAKRHKTTVATVVQLNGLTVDQIIHPGQVLVVPAGAAAPAPSTLRCPVAGASFNFDWGFPRHGGRFHEGVDMFAPAGTPVVAPVNGTVTIGNSATPGQYFVLKGVDGWQYFGAHLSKFAKQGKVAVGDVIGYVGATGNAAGTPSHLHLEMRPQTGRPINPYSHMRGACG
ncbi:MAG TPA: LysM peptidoglycan-binding domain-containing protein [Microthrixaceae bacterium]|nr:LysM peptidoglycan-binding domain-containing protein [Microthrixaceae bacterium]